VFAIQANWWFRETHGTSERIEDDGVRFVASWEIKETLGRHIIKMLSYEQTTPTRRDGLLAMTVFEVVMMIFAIAITVFFPRSQILFGNAVAREVVLRNNGLVPEYTDGPMRKGK